MPKLNETKLLRKPITVNYSVLEKLNIPLSKENDRIKLSFKGEPEITANTAFNLYVDGNFMRK